MRPRNSAARQAAAIRRRARRGLWRRLLAACGVRTPGMRRADARAARWEHGAAGEAATVRLLRRLEGVGWHVRHDLRLPGRRFNLDHVLVSPCGTAVVVPDTKAWRKSEPTQLVQGRVHCGEDDRHRQVEKVAEYARLVQAALGAPTVTVVPLVVVHGSPVAGAEFEARVPGGTVWVMGSDVLVDRLQGAVRGPADRRRAAALVSRVDAVLRPYGEAA